MKTYKVGSLLMLPYLVHVALCQLDNTGCKAVEMSPVGKPVKNIGVVLFPSFDVVNIFGALEPLNLLSLARQLNLYMIAATRDPVSTAPRAMNLFNSSFGEVIVPSHTLRLRNPGSKPRPGHAADPGRYQHAGARPEQHHPVRQRRVSAPAGRPASHDQQAQLGRDGGVRPKTYWVVRTRWVRNGHFFTASGVTADIDAVFAWIRHVWREATAAGLALGIKYERHTDPSWDPFGEQYGRSDVPPLKGDTK